MRRSQRLPSLFIRHRQTLVAQATRLIVDAATAEDVVQEAWLRLHAVSEREITEPLSYLRRIVRNLALDEHRRRARREQLIPSDPAEDPTQVTANAAGADQMLIAAQELAVVTAELARMPLPMRRAVELHRVSGATLREIADELGISVTGAHTLVTQGVDRCRRCLKRGAH
jgi:RNA polymerase sigma-70 factor (ECF subfamily)